jgi:hypothetical protein
MSGKEGEGREGEGREEREESEAASSEERGFGRTESLGGELRGFGT